jgi:hypothetical protein
LYGGISFVIVNDPAQSPTPCLGFGVGLGRLRKTVLWICHDYVQSKAGYIRYGHVTRHIRGVSKSSVTDYRQLMAYALHQLQSPGPGR